ncbi:protein kinase [Streptomyces sp. NBC_01142]|uniref:serine/threonine-protein kinase n=1 Tax=Streptomyces sp. NBC_01142 TaxID=2975865 RepID=UPI00224D71B4|nr:serine/threonine-protein kinase [Streptomyces sp. NBC_01142]MCX4826250.1 protein kinase [Streptomyces sp. NBC_01142]
MGVLVAERYRLDEPLGRGAMGEVWRATDQALSRPVAVKLLRADDGDAASERLRMEARTAARLDHPHVVSMYDSGCHDGRFYLVMELVDGWSLAQELAVHGLLDPQEAGAIGAQMAAGLSAAHVQGVIHRDIKPGNIMLTTDRIVKITDFGIACFADDASHTLTATGKILGTSSYLAPERAVGRPAVPASDVYALGCVLYELLTGRPPFLGENTPAVVQQHASAAPVPPDHLRPEIPRSLADHLLLLLAKDPAQRPTAEQAAGWLAAVEAHSDQAPPSGTVSPGGPPVPTAPAHMLRPARSRPTGSRTPSKAVIGVAGAVAFAVAAVIGASVTSGDGDPSSPPPGSTAPSTSTPPSEAPLSGAPSATASPDLSSSAFDDDKDEEKEKPERQRKRGGEKGGKH